MAFLWRYRRMQCEYSIKRRVFYWHLPLQHIRMQVPREDLEKAFYEFLYSYKAKTRYRRYRYISVVFDFNLPVVADNLLRSK